MSSATKLIPKKQYAKIVESVPLLTVDAIIHYQDGFLLVQRKNEPLKGHWWVIGGRVMKGESVEEAMRRKIHEEVGIEVGVLHLVGIYEDWYEKSAFGVPTHTCSIVFEAHAKNDKITLDAQSTSWKVGSLPKRFVTKLRNI